MGFSLKKVVKSVGKVVKQVAPMAIQAGAAYLTGGASTALGAGSGLGNLVQGAVGVGTDYLQTQVNQDQQKKLAAYNTEQNIKLADFNAQKQQALNDRAFQQNLQMWNLKNAYDSPEAQMARYEAAGLNKNLIYGQSNVSGSMPTAEPVSYNGASYDAGQYHPVDKSAQRQALALALLEHKQRIDNQAIQNELSRQRLSLLERSADRQDKLANAKIQAYNRTFNGTTGNSKRGSIYQAGDDVVALGNRFWNSDFASAIRKGVNKAIDKVYKTKQPVYGNYDFVRDGVRYYGRRG